MASHFAILYADGFGSQIGISWDDVALTASQISAHIVANGQPVTATAIVGGVTRVVTCTPGQDRSFVFPSALPVVMLVNWKGQTVPTFPWLTNINFTSP
jgi:hypothetical protein